MENLGYQLYNKLGKPKFICAPMVDQSELAFRMLTRKYGCHLCYTPMLHSRQFNTLFSDHNSLTAEDPNYLPQNFSTCPEDRPLFVQFCGNDPEILYRAAKKVEDRCDAVDINLGCPQGIARKGRYGSFLLSEPDLIAQISLISGNFRKMVEKLAKNLKVPVTCKIRILPKEEDTMKLVRKIVEAGCSILTVHGRTKEQNKQAVGKCDWDMIKKIKKAVDIPVFANGGIYTYQDVISCLQYTGVDGVMSSESLLENPALFSGKVHDLDKVALDYLEMAEKYKADTSCVRGHLFKILYAGLSKHTDLRDEMTKVKTMDEFKQVTLKLKQRREGEDPESKLGWYLRYMPKDSREAYNDFLIKCVPKNMNKDEESKENEDKCDVEKVIVERNPEDDEKVAG